MAADQRRRNHVIDEPVQDPSDGRGGGPAGDLLRRALAAGATAAAVLRPDEVVTAEWVRWKCLYGCPVSGRCLTCPPHSPTPEETRRLLDGYESILVLRFDIRPERSEWLKSAPWVLDTALRLEQELFLLGHHKVFAIAGGRSCELDAACGSPETCTSRERLRPGLAGCGIDVFSTSANAGWPLRVVATEGEPYHRYALLLVE
jgi:predicted metal-binding protein